MPFPEPLVTCVVTAFNDAAYVERAIASAFGQRGLPEDSVEVVVVDDGSTDGTVELLEAMAAGGAPVRVLRQDRRGPSVGMHRGIAAANGRYVSMLDADDEWLPHKLSSALAIFAARPEVGLVYGDCEQIDADGNVIAPSHFALNGMVPPAGRVLGRFVERNYATTTMITLPTAVARSIPETPEWAWCRDWWVATQVAQRHELDFVTEPITRYRLHGANMSASDEGRPEKTLGLFHRDLRVRRIFMRSLDLSATTLEELAAAWERHVHYVHVLVRHRGVAPTEILPVDEGDRSAAAAELAVARAAFADDPAAAGRVAFRALGFDPFSADAQQLFARARETALSEVRAPLRSVAQADRLRDLGQRRAAITAALSLPERLGAYHRFESLRRTLRTSGTPALELDAATVAERDRALDAVESGLRAAARGRHDEAAMALAAALADTPSDEHARLALDDALAALDGRPPRRGSADARAALVAPAPLGELDGARAFVGVTFASELLSDPALLAAWTAAFGEDDDATLVIYAPGGDEAAVADALAPALAAAGIGDDDARDLALVIGAATPDREAGLARGASVLLTRAAAPAPFAALPCVADASALRDRAERRFRFDELGHPVQVAVTLCAERWDDAAASPDLPAARAVAAELERRGHRAVVLVAEEWDGARARACDAALHLRGAWPYLPAPGQRSVVWDLHAGAVSPVTPAEAARFAAVVPAGDAAGAVDALLQAIAPRLGAAAPVGS
jgi:glycosyltransferase involved in cell wall biosynthesis